MANKRLQRSLKRYLSKIKSTPHRPPVQLSLNNPMLSKSFILSGCKHPKTQSFALDETQGGSASNPNPRDHDEAAQLEDIDKFLFENFRSLYLRDVDDYNDNSISSCGSNNDNRNKKNPNDDDIKEARKKKEGMLLFDSPQGSTRFYLGRGSSSSSLVSRSSLTVSEEIISTPVTAATTIVEDNDPEKNEGVAKNKLLEGSIAVLAYSSSPYDDFKNSMQEMVDARTRSHGRVDWEFMERILFCFLNLNDKKSYKYLLNAFVDVIVTLRGQTSATSASRLHDGRPSRGPATSTVMSVRRKKREHI